MIVIIGCVVVLVAILVGFNMAGGDVHSLIHPSEFITIGGAALGAMIIMSPKKTLIDLIKGMIGLLKGSPFNKATAVDMLKLMYGLARAVKQDGVLGLETHVSAPDASPLFQQAPKVKANGHLKHFVCEAFALLIDGKPTSEQLTSWLEEEIKVLEREHHQASGALAKVADSLPGFGIVAAVLGIVVTMQAIGGPVEEIGHKVGAALVGTFLGILMAYGFIAPMAARLEAMGEQEAVFLRAVLSGVVAVSEGVSPRDVVTRARRVLGTDIRPNQNELKAIFGQ
ncbi:MAG: flagellar motor stator protein MotA [Fimbriiglobus sp.]|nr:flagellar motor stator protein MotA [Fimbriiglobus sp.]